MTEQLWRKDLLRVTENTWRSYIVGRTGLQIVFKSWTLNAELELCIRLQWLKLTEVLACLAYSSKKAHLYLKKESWHRRKGKKWKNGNRTKPKKKIRIISFTLQPSSYVLCCAFFSWRLLALLVRLDRTDSVFLSIEANDQHPDVEDKRTRHETETGKMGLMLEIICCGISVASDCSTWSAMASSHVAWSLQNFK